MDRILVAHMWASRTFPLLAIELFLIVVNWDIGNRSCADTDVAGFLGSWWSVLAALAFFSGFLPQWSASAAAHWACVDGMCSTLYFVAMSWMRAKPWKCIGGSAGDALAYTYGPLLLCAQYAVPFCIGLAVSQRMSRHRRHEYTRCDFGAAVDGDDDDEQNSHDPERQLRTHHHEDAAAVVATSAPVLLCSAVWQYTRTNVSQFSIVSHYLMTSLVIGDDDCAHTNMSMFSIYLVMLLISAAVARVVTSLRIAKQNGASSAEHGAMACWDAMLSVAHLFAMVLIRAKPIKCYEHGGLQLAYAVSAPLLLLTHALAVASGYLRLRQLNPAQLRQLCMVPCAQKTD